MNRHPFDALSLGAGLAFLALAVVFVAEIDIDAALVFPLLLVLLGALGIYSAVRAQRANDEAVRMADSTGIKPDALQG